MLIADVIVVALAGAAAAWGYYQGVSVWVLVLVGCGVGVLLGSRVAPLVLDGGQRDPFAPVIALPAALLFGAVLAAALERVGLKLRRGLRRRRTLDALGGALMAGFVAFVLVWIAAAVVARVDSLKETVRDSVVIGLLNSVLPPPGPLLGVAEPLYSFPVTDRPRGQAGRAGPRIKQDPEVEAAARSVVKVIVGGCGQGGSGSGWIAGEGIVVTNAHVVAGTDQPGVKIEGGGETHDSEPIWYDPQNDVAILRTPEARGRPALSIGRAPKAGKAAAVLGFPLGERYKAREARLGRTGPFPPGLPRGLKLPIRRRSTYLRAGLGVAPGSSGSPVVDKRGRVVAMIWGSWGPNVRRNKVAVPGPVIQKALRSALSSPTRVDTGECRED